jgi:Spy/CpxP family protein refolding chaperone
MILPLASITIATIFITFLVQDAALRDRCCAMFNLEEEGGCNYASRTGSRKKLFSYYTGTEAQCLAGLRAIANAINVIRRSEMKRAVLLVVAGLAVCLAFAYSAEAQMAGQKGMMKGMGGSMMGGGMANCDCGMMQGRGMMGRGMMRGEMMRGHHRMMHICMKRLGLSAKQKEEIEGIRVATMKEVIRKRADMQIARLELRELLSKEPVDMKAVEAKVKQIEGLRADIHLAIIRAKEEVKAKLTPEQRQKLMDMMGKSPMMGNTDEEMEAQPPAGMGDANEGMEEQAPAEMKDEIQPESEDMEQMQ